MSLLYLLRKNSISHLISARIRKRSSGFVSNPSLPCHNPANIYIGPILVSSHVWSFIAARRYFPGLFKSIETQASPDEAEMTVEVVNQILQSIETTTVFNKVVCNDIERLCRFGGGLAMAKLLQILRKKHISHHSEAYNILLTAASEMSNFELSVEIFKDLLLLSALPSSKSYINFAKAFMNTDDCTLLLNFVDEICELGIHRGVLVFNRIIFAFAECRQIDKALIIFDYMKNQECKPDLFTYNTVLGIYGRSGKVNEMLQEFSYMKEAKIVPDVVSYNTLLYTFHKFGRLDLCLVYMKEMEENRLFPDLKTYTALIESFGKSGNIEEALRLFNAMKYRQVKLSIYIYRSLINNSKKMGKLDVAALLWDEMNSSLPKLVGPKDFKKKH